MIIPNLYPSPIPDPRLDNLNLQLALAPQIAACELRCGLPMGSLPVRFTFMEVRMGPGVRNFPSTGYQEKETDYIASEAKVAVMYSVYALRDMVRRFAHVNRVTKPDDLFNMLSDTQMKDSMLASIRTLVPRVASATLLPPSTIHITDEHRLPKYRDMFLATPNDSGTLDVNFTTGFREKGLVDMITEGHNEGAAKCVHGVGYGYLNAALTNNEFFNRQIENGLWVAGDFLGERPIVPRGIWPYVRIPSRNDKNVAQTGTTYHMAKLVSLIQSKRLLGTADCDEMLSLLGPASWLKDPVTPPGRPRKADQQCEGILRADCITHAKVGRGPLHGLSGPDVYSEVTVVEGPVAPGKIYVVAWQNLLDPPDDHYNPTGRGRVKFRDIATIIQDTISMYETFPTSP